MAPWGLAKEARGLIRHAQFAAQLHTLFHTRLNSGETVPIRLVKAPLAAARFAGGLAADGAHEQFSLIFTGSSKTVLDSAIYTFEHDELGRFQMHLGEVGRRSGESISYEAVFDQIVPTGRLSPA